MAGEFGASLLADVEVTPLSKVRIEDFSSPGLCD